MDSKAISESIDKNEQYLKKTIGKSTDIGYRRFTIPSLDQSNALIVFINRMVDNKEIDEFILEPLMKCRELPKFGSVSKIPLLASSGIFIKQAEQTKEWTKICDAVVQGDTALFIDKCDTAILLSTRSLDTRSILDPQNESEVKGPRDSFIESIAVNGSLIRRRIKDYALRFENMKLGERTKTDVALVYIENLVNDSILTELRTRLNRIKTDSILASAYIEEFIQDAPRSIFPQIEHTERPDKACSAILEGRIVILADNTPFALIVPTVFWNFLHASGDYYERPFFGTFFRIIRVIALLLSFTLSSLYVLLSAFHQEMLPTNLALKIAEGRAGVPFPALIEAFIMDIMLEIMKEAGLRMPKPVGQTVSIVGTFIIGQAAVVAGIVSPVLVIFITVAAICSYALPYYGVGNALRIIRFAMLMLSGCLGILGFFAGLIVIVMHLLSLRSFGSPFLAPIIPFDASATRDVIIRAPWWKMGKRGNTGKPKDSVRQAPNLKPTPPQKNGQT